MAGEVGAEFVAAGVAFGDEVDVGIANPAQRDADQMRDLNAISRQLVPDAPIPAPEAASPR